MFAHVLTLSLPPISPVAILSFCARADACLLRSSHINMVSNSHPGNNPGAIDRARRMLSSVVADLECHDSHHSSSPAPRVRHSSDRFQDDWARLRCTVQSCEGPSETVPSAINIRRLITLLSGIWEGRVDVSSSPPKIAVLAYICFSTPITRSIWLFETLKDHHLVLMRVSSLPAFLCYSN